MSTAFCDDELRFLSDMSANLAKSVSWSMSRADFLDSNTRTSSNFLITSIEPCGKRKSCYYCIVTGKCNVLYIYCGNGRGRIQSKKPIVYSSHRRRR